MQLLKPTQFVCPAYDDEVKDVQKQFMKTLFLSNVEFYKFVREHAGFDNFGLEELKSLAEAAKEVDHGMKQPEWLAKKWPNKGGKSTLQIIKGWFLLGFEEIWSSGNFYQLFLISRTLFGWKIESFEYSKIGQVPWWIFVGRLFGSCHQSHEEQTKEPTQNDALLISEF